MTIGSTLSLTFLPLWLRLVLVCVLLIASTALYVAIWLGLVAGMLSLLRLVFRKGKQFATRVCHSFLTKLGIPINEESSENERAGQQSADEELGHNVNSRQTEREDPYSILGVPRGASRDAIQRAYREQMKLYHPDRVQHLGEVLRKTAHEQAIRIQEAYRPVGEYL